MPCIQCGGQLGPGDGFCPKCGAKQAAAVALTADPLRAALDRALGAHYDIQRLLGRGGMGAVYLARERSLDRLVAIKILPPETAADAESRERFRREARTAAKLTHPNIVPLHAFGDVEGMLYFVMGYVRGESLAERLRRDGRLPADQARRILKEVADALEHAHRQGVVHRDIKPDNVLLDDETGRPMLTDFGVAKARASGATLTEAGMVLGTPHYMSPEQASGARDVDGRSDLYSLGVLGYVMLAGRVPFEGDGFRDLIVQHISREPPPLEALAPEAPRELVAAVTRCLAKAPEQRWPDARSLAAAVGYQSAEEEAPQRFPLQHLDGGLAGYTGAVLGSLVYSGVAISLGGLGDMGRAIRDFFGPLGGLAAVVLTLIPVGLALIARRRGHGWAEIRTLFLRPPARWRWWWPAVWRRPSDLWNRLPEPLRRIRGLLSAGLGLTLGMLVGFVAVAVARELGLPQAVIDALGALAVLPGAAGLGAIIAATWRQERWGRTVGLSAQDASLAAQTATTDLAFWAKPKFAALLEPAGMARASLAEPPSPAGYVTAIEEAVRQLAEPVRGLGREAAEAARQLAAAIAALDGEIGQLARDANPADLAPIERKLAALGDAATDNEARRKMRTLLESQRDLVRGLTDQLEVASARRAHLADLLRALRLQVANLRAQGAADTVSDSGISGRIRAIAGEITVQADALATVRAIAPPDRGD